MNNQITATGRLTNTPEVRFTPSGANVTSFTIAFNDRKQNADGKWEDGQAHYLDVSAWRQLGESCADLQKGQRVVVVGELKSRTWETRDGDKRTAWQIEAAEVGVLLDRFGGSKPQQGAGWSKDTKPSTGADPWATTASDDTPPF